MTKKETKKYDEVEIIDDADKVWVNCRASNKCPGNYAKKMRTEDVPYQGKIIQYRCLSCGGSFSINY